MFRELSDLMGETDEPVPWWAKGIAGVMVAFLVLRELIRRG